MVKHGEFVKLCLHLKCVCVRVIKENVSTEMMVAGGGGGQQQRALPSSKKYLILWPWNFLCSRKPVWLKYSRQGRKYYKTKLERKAGAILFGVRRRSKAYWLSLSAMEIH